MTISHLHDANGNATGTSPDATGSAPMRRGPTPPYTGGRQANNKRADTPYNDGPHVGPHYFHQYIHRKHSALKGLSAFQLLRERAAFSVSGAPAVGGPAMRGTGFVQQSRTNPRAPFGAQTQPSHTISSRRVDHEQ